MKRELFIYLLIFAIASSINSIVVERKMCAIKFAEGFILGFKVKGGSF